MNHQHTNFGPWTTSLDSGSRMQLSAFWRQRMRRLPGLATARQMPRRMLAVALMLAIAVGLVPLVKLVPAAPVEEAAKEFPRLDFGKIVERTINDDNSELGKFMIDLDTGRFLSMPKQMGSQRELIVWLEKNGVDAIGEVKQSFKGLYGCDLVAIPTSEDNWEPHSRILSQVDLGRPGSPVPISGQGKLPATYLFKTREGNRGVLQILKILEIDDDQAVKIRYKLLDLVVPPAPQKEDLPTTSTLPVVPDAQPSEKPFPQIIPPGSIEGDKTSNLVTRATRAGDPNKGERAAAMKQYHRQLEIVKQLAEKHGYRLKPNQLLKYLGEPLPKLRNHFEDEPCVNFFQSTPEWTRWTGRRLKEGTLAIALKGVLHLRPNQIECDPALLDRPFPGDWVASWDPRKFRSPTFEEVAAFEEAVNTERTSKLAFEWKQVEEVSLVVKGHYKYSPVSEPDGELEVVEGEVSKQANHTFQFPIRRNSTTGSVGSYPEFLQAIGEVVGMAVVDETVERPAKRSLFWYYDKKLIPGTAPLGPALEKTFLDSLSQQTGFQFVKEKRLVHKLFIKAEPAISSDR